MGSGTQASSSPLGKEKPPAVGMGEDLETQGIVPSTTDCPPTEVPGQPYQGTRLAVEDTLGLSGL